MAPEGRSACCREGHPKSPNANLSCPLSADGEAALTQLPQTPGALVLELSTLLTSSPASMVTVSATEETQGQSYSVNPTGQWDQQTVPRCQCGGATLTWGVEPLF